MGLAALRVALLLVVVFAAAFWDARTRRIPNPLTFGGMLAGLLLWVIAGEFREALIVLSATVGVLAGGMVFQAGGVLGGGDVKLLGAIAAIAGLRFFGEAMFWTLLVGVVVSFGILGRSRALFPLFRRLGRIIRDVFWHLQPEPAVEGEGHRMPFGIIIAIGCVAALGAERIGWTVLP